ncbi:hypothetical protein [Paenarthrobacter sp. C1]|uniref:hypothetical protein n=1 Tax=Paenarthrobacter sp. C1 TaxID=3400220 RepID=UPI003BF4D3B4
MGRWPFGVRGGLTTLPFSSDDPVVCAHQAVCLKALLAQFEGDYEATCMVLNRLEIVYFSAGRRQDADLVHADKIALVEPSHGSGEGIVSRLLSSWRLHRSEARFRHAQRVIDYHLADLHRRAPWACGHEVDASKEAGR